MFLEREHATTETFLVIKSTHLILLRVIISIQKLSKLKILKGHYKVFKTPSKTHLD